MKGHRIIIFCSLLFIVLVNAERSVNITLKNFSGSNFGPYFLKTRSIEKCDTSKKSEEENGFCMVDLYVHKVSRTKEEYKGVVALLDDITITKVSMHALLWKDGGFKPFYDQIWKDPCDNIMLSTLMKKFVNPDRNCNVKKGNYTIQDVSANELAHILTGDNFFYERVAFTMQWFTVHGATCCSKVICESKPKAKPVKKKNN